MQIGINLSQQDNPIPDSWIILDSGSTATVFKSKRYLNDIIACGEDDGLDLTSNGGGRLSYTMRSKLQMFPLDVFYNEDSLANIIALFDLIRVPDIVVTMDNREDYGFHVTYKGKGYQFNPFHSGLYYYDTRVAPQDVVTINPNTKSMLSPYSFLQTVNDNKKFYTAAEIKEAENACIQQEELGWPSDTFYAKIINNNLFINTEITPDDVQRAMHIFGPAKPLLQGAMTRLKPISNKIEKVTLPPVIY